MKKPTLLLPLQDAPSPLIARLRSDCWSIFALFFVFRFLCTKKWSFSKKKNAISIFQNERRKSKNTHSLSPAWGKRICSALALHEKPNADK